MAELSVDVYSAALAKTNIGPLRPLSAGYSFELDKIGGFEAEFAAEDDLVAQLAEGHVLYLYHEGEGLVYRGIVDSIEIVETAAGEHVARVAGGSLARQLVWANTLLGREFEGSTLATAVAALLTGTGWSSSLGVPATNITGRFDGVSVWQALARVAQVFAYHLREDPLTRTVTLNALGTVSTAIHAANIPQVAPELGATSEVAPIAEMTLTRDGADIWNSVIPLGAGESVDQLSLRWSDRSSPYTISSATGPDGRTYYYLEDATSVASYGTRRSVLAFKDAIPLANSDAGFLAAANALYDVAATWLQRHKDPVREYAIKVPVLSHVSGGSYRFQVGDKIRTTYRGWSTDLAGVKRAFLTVDADLWLTGLTRKWGPDGDDRWELRVSTVDRGLEDEGEILGQAVQGIRAIQVSPRPYTYREIHDLTRQSIDTGKTATMIANFDANVSLLHQAKLTFFVRALRSNVSVAASGGGSTATSTSGGSSTPTSSSGGGTTVTSTSGGSSTPTSSAAGAHRHQMWGDDPDNTAYDLGFPTGAMTTSPNTGAGSSHAHGTHAHLENLAGAYTQNAPTDTSSVPGESSHTHPMGAHVHYLTSRRVYVNADSNPAFNTLASAHVMMSDAWTGTAAYTYTAQADHTHTVTISGHTHDVTIGGHTHTVTISAHTHDVTIPSHTHSLTYGIFDASAPVNPAITITINGTDRTAAITTAKGDGGAWRNVVGSAVEVDLSAWLGSNGQPLRADNTIVIGASVLCDVEAKLRSLVTATSLIPV